MTNPTQALVLLEELDSRQRHPGLLPALATRDQCTPSRSTCVSVKVVPQQRDCPESPATEVALVWSFIGVAFHVAVQVGATWTSVTAQFALECLLYT